MLTKKNNISAALDVLKQLIPSKKDVLTEPSMLLSKDDFCKHLEVERLRADRSNSYFTMLVLSISRPSLQNEQKIKLYDFLNREFRITDSIGWIDDENLGIILYAADREEAFSFLRRLKEKGSVPVIADSYTACFTYPYEKDQIDSRISGKRRNDRIEIQLNAEITLLTQEGGKGVPLTGIVSRDISESGVYLETKAPFELGQEVNVTIRLPLTCSFENTENQVQIKALGKIVRKQDQGMAIAFESCELLPRTKE